MRSDREHGGQYLRLVEGEFISQILALLPTNLVTGTQSFSRCLADRLEPGSVILSSPVRSIQQTGKGVHVMAGRGDYQCQRVIVSVPTPLYKEISFEPPLPKAKLELSRKTVLGCTIKVILLYQSPWWRTKNLTGVVQSFKGPVVVARDTSVEEKNQFSLTCFVVGAGGLEWARKAKAERWALVHDQIKEIFSPFVEVPQPIKTVEMNWVEEQWSQGCPCPAMPPGVVASFGRVLRMPHGRIHFVGTETALEWKGYMEGAARSGEHGAKEVIQAVWVTIYRDIFRAIFGLFAI
jgi:monoamine oxidase